MLRLHSDPASRTRLPGVLHSSVVVIAGLLALLRAVAAPTPLPALAAAVRSRPADAIDAARLGSALMHRDWLVPAHAPADASFVVSTGRVAPGVNEFPAPSRRLRLRLRPNAVELVQESDGTVSASVESAVAWESVAWHPSSAVVVLGRPGAFEIRDGQTLSKQPFDYAAVDGAAFAFSPDGLWLAATHPGGGVDLWDWSEGVVVAHGLTARTGFTDLTFSKDGRHLRAGLRTGPVVLDARPSRVLGPSMVSTSAVVHAVAFPDRNRALTVHADGLMRFWTGAEKEPANQLRFASVPHMVVDAADHRSFVTLLFPGKARVWDSGTLRPIGEWLNHPGGLAGVALDGNRRHVWTAGGNSVRCWEFVKASSRLVNVTTGAPIATLAGSPNAGWVGVIRLAESGPTLGWWPSADTNGIAVHEVRLGATNILSFAPGSQQVLAATAPSRVQRWGLAGGETAGPEVDHGSPIAFVRWTPDAHTLVTVGTDHSVKVWDLTVPKPAPVVLQGLGPVLDLDVSAKADHLLVCGQDHGWRVVDVATGRTLTESWPVVGRMPASRPVRIAGTRFTPGGAEVLVPDTVVGARWVPLPPVEAAPAWLSEVAAAVAGEGEGDPVARLDAVRAELARNPSNRDAWSGWGRWWLGDRSTRPTSPGDTLTAERLVNRGLDLNVPAGLMELIRLDPSAPRLRAQLMEQMWTNIFWARPRRMEQAGWLRQRGTVDPQ